MKIVALLLSLCLTLNVFAASGSIQGLERAMDEYQYALSVEWDQKDNTFYQAKTDAFFKEIKNLMKNEGLSKDQVMTLVEKRVNSKATLEALKLKVNLLSGAKTSEELAKLLKESTTDMYSRGASWGGEVIVPAVFGLLIVGLIGYSVWFDATHECIAWEQQYVCSTYNSCGGYYDPYYGGGSYCYNQSYTTCGWTDVCTEYQKKD